MINDVGSVQSLLILTIYLTIIAIIMALLYGSLGGVLFTGAIILYVYSHPIPSLILAIISIYFFIESGRWAYWKDVHYNESEGASNIPPPKNLIRLLIRRK